MQLIIVFLDLAAGGLCIIPIANTPNTSTAPKEHSPVIATNSPVWHVQGFLSSPNLQAYGWYSLVAEDWERALLLMTSMSIR